MNSSLPPVNREELRIGGAVVFLGGVGAFVANLFHPVPPHETEALLRLVAAAPHWSQPGDVDAQSGPSHGPRDRNGGRYVLILGGAVYLVEVMVDGFATKFF